MKKILPLFFLLYSFVITAQDSIQKEVEARLIDLHEVGYSDENFVGYEQIKKEIGDAEIVLLGEQSHGDATTFEAKIKLIKYLHQEMDFEILAFESNLYECDRAWSMVQEGQDVKNTLAKGIYAIWSTLEELDPLYHYVAQRLESKSPLMITGFDTQFIGSIAVDHFAEDLTAYLTTFEGARLYQEEIQELQSFINTTRLGKLKKKKAVPNMAFLQQLIVLIQSKQNDDLSSFWVQTLKNLKIFISDMALETDNRDQQMADNLIWLKEKYPDKKIMCWGATSHFLYNSSSIRVEEKKLSKSVDDYYRNHSMMGDYLKKKYGDKVYTIGFIAHEGSFAAFGLGRPHIIDLPSKNSVEYLIGKSANNNYFLPLKNLSLEGYVSRPLGHQNMINDIAQVMDGVIFNRKMRRPYIDWNLYLDIYPENKMWKKKKERFRKYSTERSKSKLAQKKQANINEQDGKTILTMHK